MPPNSTKFEVDEKDDLLKLEDYRDTLEAYKSDVNYDYKKIYPMKVAFLAIWHVLAVYGVFLLPETMYQTLLYSLWMYSMGVLGITLAAHRFWSHRSFKAKLPLKLFMIWTQCVSYQYSIINWVRDHRVHHRFSETDADPHNAKRGFIFCHIGWMVSRKHPDVHQKGKDIDISDVQSDPYLAFQHRHYFKLAVLFSVILPPLVPMYMWNETLLNSFCVSVALRYVMNLHAVFSINSFSHMYGTRPYDKRLNPSDNQLVSMFNLGEGCHNFHHTFPHDYCGGEAPSKFNFTTNFLHLMVFLGQAYACKKISKEAVLRRRKRTGDLSSLPDSAIS